MENEKLWIASNILEQLGGRKFMIMTGAKNMMALDNGLSFSLPGGGGFTKHGINRVRVFLTWDDLYTVMYETIRGKKRTIISHHEGLYADQLQADFTRETGLYTHL